MAIAITVFAPFLANKASTVAFVAAVAATYYVGLVVSLDDIHKYGPLLRSTVHTRPGCRARVGDLAAAFVARPLTSFGTHPPDPASQVKEG